MTYLLDTDHMSELQRGKEAAQILSARLRLISLDDYGTSIISYKEQTEGWLADINKAKNTPLEVVYFARLNAVLRFYNTLAVWQYDEAAAQFAAWKAAKVSGGTQDLKIAAIAYVSDATVLTRNIRHFSKIPGLLIADWTTAPPDEKV